jgi:hypothetical protein
MKTLLIKALGPLASLAYQERHLVHWSGDECRLPRELIDTAVVELGDQLDHPTAGDLSADERHTIEHCFEVLCLHATALSFEDIIDMDELVHKNEHWLIIRYMATDTLVALGSSVQEWERNNIPGSVPPIGPGTALAIDSFGADRLLVTTDVERSRVLSDLASVLTARLRVARDFDEAVAEITAELWGLGHDLERIERTEDREVWSPEGAIWPNSPGIAIELHRSGIATVRWAEARRAAN